MSKKIIPSFFMKKKKVMTDRNEQEILSNAPVQFAMQLRDKGADAIMITDLSGNDNEHEEALYLIKEMVRSIDIPILLGGNVKRMEDVKKILYAGAEKAILDFGGDSNVKLLEEVSKRFGKEKIAVLIDDLNPLSSDFTCLESYAGEAILDYRGENMDKPTGGLKLPVIALLHKGEEAVVMEALKKDNVAGAASPLFCRSEYDCHKLKETGLQLGIPMHVTAGALQWADLKVNDQGLLPVIVQDYKTDEVLMLAYMNEEAFEATVKTDKMTYYSRSRKELWVKGLTSGHYQYVKSLQADCDYDTLLAKVQQVGAACHTGNRTCFFNPIIQKEEKGSNPLQVLWDVFKVIEDRKINPREGSYTNYLFDKGIDKILKKLGEEATEIVIAAKNPNPEEIKYEISDFLYHAMVLMSVKGVTWEEIMEELANR